MKNSYKLRFLAGAKILIATKARGDSQQGRGWQVPCTELNELEMEIAGYYGGARKKVTCFGSLMEIAHEKPTEFF